MKFKRFFVFGLCLILSFALNSNLALASNSNDFFGPEADKLHKKIADKSIFAAKEFVSAFNKKSESNIAIKDTFYDQKFHRLYIEIEGTLAVSKSIHKMFIKGEKIYSSDGQFAFDFLLKNPVSKNGNMVYEIDGELIVFQENILSSIARVTPGVNLAYNPIGETVLKFLEEARVRKLANLTAEVLTSFSPEKLEKLKKELQNRADEMGDTNLKKVLYVSSKMGHFAHFFVLCLVKNIPTMLGEMTGSSIGSVVGSFLLPGAGTIVGAYVGSVISGQIIYASQYRIPIHLKLARMKTLGKLSKNGSEDNIAGKKFTSLRKDFNKDIRKDLDKHSYIVVDEVLKALKEMKKKHPGLFEVIGKDLQTTLQYQLVQENDRYAARKLKQLGNL